jgi:hypothetical protein
MGQLLQLIPRQVFDCIVDSHPWQGPKPRKFTHWSHLAAMLFGQWSARKSLRDLTFSLSRPGHKLDKWIKQNLKIKAFDGTSKNAVLIQVWTAWIAYLLLVRLKLKSRVGWGLLELPRLAQTMLLKRCNL